MLPRIVSAASGRNETGQPLGAGFRGNGRASQKTKTVKQQNIGNVVIAGHMASDSVGINQVIKALEKKGLEVIRMSGVIDPR